MKKISKLLDQESFLKNLFEAIPCGLLIIDSKRRVQAINNVLEMTLGISSTLIVNKLGGEALNCITALKKEDSCGSSEECQTCQIRRTAEDALYGKQIHRRRAKMRLIVNGDIRDFQLLLSAAPFAHDGEKLAIILLEDMTELNELRKRLKTEQSFAGIIGQDPRMIELFETIENLADVNVPVLIQGESGTGKELVAAAIHSEGPRSNKPFVPVNCGALPEGLLESELFGHIKGAFTGAVRNKKGRFELADCGTLFLDEIADLPKVVQAKLLRVLQDGKFERVGDEKTILVDVRIISAANRDLKGEMKAGNFRADLYYRINVVPVYLPPLKERKNDIPLLIKHFIYKASKEGQKATGISKDAIAIMMDHPWPGNVRELQSVIRYALIKSKGEIIQEQHLPPDIIKTKNIPFPLGQSKKLNPDSVRDALIKSGGNKAKAARFLGVARATLYRFFADNPDAS